MIRLRSQRLQRVAEVAERRTDQAARTFAERVHGLDDAQRQLAELRRFRQEYALRPGAGGDAAVPVTQLCNRQQFVARIDEAIVQQQQNIQQCARQLTEARTEWLKSRNRSVALDQAARRCRAQEQAVEERGEQAVLDERAQRQAKPWPAA